ncbi:MAG: hypothetical protein JNK15_23705 [Planctomycetes bacterium]|nr:hypothetical protein [Planctomycetota bacterium]
MLRETSTGDLIYVRQSRLAGFGSRCVAAAALLACIAAGYGLARVNASNWRDSDELARVVLANPSASQDQRRDALYVIFRHEEQNSKLMKAASLANDKVGEHAKNLLAATRDLWR